MRLGLGLGLPCSGRAVGAAAPYQQILALAASDGWTAVYDPTNPETRTLRADGSKNYVTEIEDGLGNLPALRQATEANQPLLVPGGFGVLDAMEFNGTSTNLVVPSAEMTAIERPFILSMLERKGAYNFSMLWAGSVATDRFLRFNSSSGIRWAIEDSGIRLHSASTASEGESSLFSAKFVDDPGNSKAWINSALEIDDLLGTGNMEQITWGMQSNNLVFHDDYIGVGLVRSDGDETALRRMEDLILSFDGTPESAGA